MINVLLKQIINLTHTKVQLLTAQNFNLGLKLLNLILYVLLSILNEMMNVLLFYNYVFFVVVSVYSITCRNNASISNFRGGFRLLSEYPWCIIEVKSKHFPTVFKKIDFFMVQLKILAAQKKIKNVIQDSNLTFLFISITIVNHAAPNVQQSDYERSDECIDFTMIITSRNNASISNFGGGFRWKSEYPWYIIEVKIFKKIEKNKKKNNQKMGIFTQNQFSTESIFLYGCNSKTNHCKYLKFSPNVYLFIDH
ncbi:hypothetical protein AGLY_009706 [Aphis glycines]|uniref:Uncharacterized protein n=1 Tax=Aphis glycines TaxID=307491 RepID=A0A6G0THW5_APHGL|nr:hypothetical protein AGLY_009706 [Aphis glycines]